jgi:phage head maturation protease
VRDRRGPIEYGCPVEGFRVDGRSTESNTGTQARKATRSKQILQGWCCHYGVEHKNYKTGLIELFEKRCFAGSFFGVMFLRDHVLTETKIADQDDGTLELVDTDLGIAFRLHLKDGDLEKLDGRDELSVGYIVRDAELRKDGVRLIKSAALIEVSACYVGAVRQTFAEIRSADAVGKLADEATHLVCEGAGRGFLRALRNLE